MPFLKQAFDLFAYCPSDTCDCGNSDRLGITSWYMEELKVMLGAGPELPGCFLLSSLCHSVNNFIHTEHGKVLLGCRSLPGFLSPTLTNLDH